jgi:dolichol kinase
VVASIVAVLTILAIRNPRGVRHDRGENWLQTCVTFAVPPVIMLCLFRGNAEYASVMICVLAFGDSTAAIAGRLLGGKRLPWNAQKTWVGLFGFIIVAGVVASLAYWGEARNPRVSIQAAIICGTSAAILGGIAETLPMRLDDNLRISIASAIGVVAASTILASIA